MTKFNPEGKDNLTFGELLDPIFKITDPEDAKQYKAAYVRWHSNKYGSEKAEANVNSNIGYYAGYGSESDRIRIERLFLCSHPIFGAIEDNGAPTGKEAFECGFKNKTLTQIRQS